MADIDFAVVGAGPAGLAAALTLSRALQTTAVLASPQAPRNAASQAISAVIGRDGMAPQAFLAAARSEIAGYGRARFVDEAVTAIDGRPGRFTLATDAGRRVDAAAVILACGMRDRMPDIEGLGDFWGRSVMNCPFCDGLEHRGRRWGVIVNRPEMLDVAPIYQVWAGDLALFVDEGVAIQPAQEAALRQRGVTLERRAVRRLLGRDGRLEAVGLSDGAVVARDTLVLWPFQEHTALVEGLGLALDDGGFVAVDEGYRTSREGIYAAGDLLYGGHQNINTAAHMGNLAGATAVLDKALRGR